jgi:hypothetical protein
MNFKIASYYRAGFIIILLINLFTPAFAQQDTVAVIPFFLKQQKIYFKCSVNNSDSLTFLFDTGASPMVITDSVALNQLKMVMDSKVENQGANGISTVHASTNNQLTLGGITLSGIRFLSIPYPGHPFDGVLGLDVMKRYVIKVDYRKHKLLFFNKDTFKYKGTGSVAKVKFVEHVPALSGAVMIGSKRYKGWFEMDTGSDAAVDLTTSFVNRYHFRDKLKTIAISTALGSDGNKSELYIVRMPEVRLSNYRFYLIPTGLATVTKGLMASPALQGVLGNNFLKRFNITYDFSRNMVYLEPNDLLHSSYFDWLNYN